MSNNLRFVAKIVKACVQNKGRFLTIRQLSKIAGMSYNATYRTVHSLRDENVLNLTKIGSASVVQLTDTEKTRGFIALAESYSTGKNEKKK